MNISMEVAKRIDEIFLRHRERVLKPAGCAGSCPAGLIAAGLKNLECMGYTLDSRTITGLYNTDEAAVAEFFERVQCAVNTIVMNNPSRDIRLKYEPMYPGFPDQVMELESAVLFINAILHYCSSGKWLPGHEKSPRSANSGDKFVPVRLRILKSGTLDEFKSIFINLMNANTSISASDADDLLFFFENFDDAIDFIPRKPVFKENCALISGICMKSKRFTPEEFAMVFGDLFATPVDVLRFAVSISGGDVSLADTCRFKSFTRHERRTLLGLLNSKSSLLENMVRKREVWLRLGERLHPGEYPQYSRIAGAFRALRRKTKVNSFAGKVNRACECGLFDEVTALLSLRPGDFARALDRVLRNAPDQKMVLDAFDAVADRVNTRVLLEIRTHFMYRSNENFLPMSSNMSPEEIGERKKKIMQAKQAKVEKEVAERLKKNDRFVARAGEWYAEAVQELQAIEDAEAKRLSDLAILDSTFDREQIIDELQQRSLSDDELSSAISELAVSMVENTYLAATNAGLHSMMKSYGIETPYERSRRLALEKIERRKANVERQKELRARHLLALRRQRMHSSRRKRPALDCSSVRVFFPKGCLAKSYIVENDLTGIPADSCERVVAICERILKEKYSELESMGKVWISEKLRDYIVPFSRRSASKSLRTITRGSRLRFSDDVQVVRGFIWWKNAKTNWRTDLDLSALLLDEHWQYVEHVSFTNLRSTKTGSCHSGDIVNAPAGAAEYIDIDLQKAQKAGARYVVFSVHGFTVQNFCDLPECSFGWMERETAASCEIFNASAIGNKIDLSMASRCGVPLFFDLQEKCAVWMDMATESPLRYWNSVESNAGNILSVCRGLEQMHKPDMYTLAMLHAQARGIPVENKEDADLIFDLEDGITPFDTDIWMAEYI